MSNRIRPDAPPIGRHARAGESRADQPRADARKPQRAQSDVTTQALRQREALQQRVSSAAFGQRTGAAPAVSSNQQMLDEAAILRAGRDHSLIPSLSDAQLASALTMYASMPAVRGALEAERASRQGGVRTQVSAQTAEPSPSQVPDGFNGVMPTQQQLEQAYVAAGHSAESARQLATEALTPPKKATMNELKAFYQSQGFQPEEAYQLAKQYRASGKSGMPPAVSADRWRFFEAKAVEDGSTPEDARIDGYLEAAAEADRVKAGKRARSGSMPSLEQLQQAYQSLGKSPEEARKLAQKALDGSDDAAAP